MRNEINDFFVNSKKMGLEFGRKKRVNYNKIEIAERLRKSNI